jgi:hypothetical protein
MPYSVSVLLLMLTVLCTHQVRGQSIFPAGSVPPELTDAQTVQDTLFRDTVGALSASTTLRTSPNSFLSGSFFPSFSGSDPQVWGPLAFTGHTLSVTFEADANYLLGFPAQPTLFQQQYILKVYAPGDSALTTPIYENDSLFLQMTSGTPRVDFRLDLGSVLAHYVPQSGLLGADSTDTSSVTGPICDSIILAYSAGLDSVLVSGSRIDIGTAMRMVDSMDLAARGVSSSLIHDLPVFYRLTPVPASSYSYPGFSPGAVTATVSTGYSVILTGGTIIHSLPYTGGGVITGPGGGVLTRGGGIIIYGSGGWSRWPCTTPEAVTSVALTNPAQINWTGCPQVNYEIQILRLYNDDPTTSSVPNSITATVDWSQALDLETNTGDQFLKLTIDENTGWYVCRVRHILDAYANTIGDDRNWGPWTPTGPFTDGTTLTVNPGMASAYPYLFYYTVFDDTLNYIYHRQFVEGEIAHGSQLRMGEKTTYANFLLMPQQEQVKAQTANNILASQTVPDNNGRPQLQTLPAPIGKTGFGYEYNYIKNPSGNLYTANDYDQQSNYQNPSIVNGTATSKIVAYYSNLNGDVQIPNSDSIPFTRTLNYNDGLNRAREIASPGRYHTFGSGHTVKKYYGSPASDELIYLFGDEAPASESALKTYTQDPNGVLNVAYTDEITGKVLATCLSAPESPLLDTIPGHIITVTDTVDSKIYGYSPSRLTQTKTYTFALPTVLSYVYKIVNRQHKVDQI